MLPVRTGDNIQKAMACDSSHSSVEFEKELMEQHNEIMIQMDAFLTAF